jgi:hypothetical protein
MIMYMIKKSSLPATYQHFRKVMSEPVVDLGISTSDPHHRTSMTTLWSTVENLALTGVGTSAEIFRLVRSQLYGTKDPWATHQPAN